MLSFTQCLLAQLQAHFFVWKLSSCNNNNNNIAFFSQLVCKNLIMCVHYYILESECINEWDVLLFQGTFRISYSPPFWVSHAWNSADNGETSYSGECNPRQVHFELLCWQIFRNILQCLKCLLFCFCQIALILFNTFHIWMKNMTGLV